LFVQIRKWIDRHHTSVSPAIPACEREFPPGN
jgi:hypothetical protein